MRTTDPYELATYLATLSLEEQNSFFAEYSASIKIENMTQFRLIFEALKPGAQDAFLRALGQPKLQALIKNFGELLELLYFCGVERAALVIEILSQTHIVKLVEKYLELEKQKIETLNWISELTKQVKKINSLTIDSARDSEERKAHEQLLKELNEKIASLKAKPSSNSLIEEFLIFIDVQAGSELRKRLPPTTDFSKPISLDKEALKAEKERICAALLSLLNSFSEVNLLKTMISKPADLARILNPDLMSDTTFLAYFTADELHALIPNINYLSVILLSLPLESQTNILSLACFNQRFDLASGDLFVFLNMFHESQAESLLKIFKLEAVRKFVNTPQKLAYLLIKLSSNPVWQVNMLDSLLGAPHLASLFDISTPDKLSEIIKHINSCEPAIQRMMLLALTKAYKHQRETISSDYIGAGASLFGSHRDVKISAVLKLIGSLETDEALDLSTLSPA